MPETHFQGAIELERPRRCGAAILRSTLPKTAFFGLRCNDKIRNRASVTPAHPRDATTTILHALGTFLRPQDEHFVRATRDPAT